MPGVAAALGGPPGYASIDFQLQSVSLSGAGEVRDTVGRGSPGGLGVRDSSARYCWSMSWICLSRKINKTL